MPKLTVAVVLYKRPGYSRETLDALSGCQGFDSIVDKVFISIDDALNQGETLRVAESWARGVEKPVEIIRQRRRNGIVGNSILALKAGFDSGSERVLYVEDDAVLSPDGLILADYMSKLDPEKYLACGLSRGNKPHESKEPWALVENNVHPCPYAWTIHRQQWDFVLKNWCNKHYQPCGWSFAMTFNARMENKAFFLAPKLARVKNIGREDGTNGDRFVWDESLRDIPFSDGSYDGQFEIVEKISHMEAGAIGDAWMQSEISREPSAKFDNWLGFGRPEQLGPGI